MPFFDKNICLDITVTDICDSFYISTSTLYRVFKEKFDMSPKQFIIDLRIRKAKQLLSEQLLRISEISDNCGFSNPYHFCRLFKLHTGTTPLQYRKSNPADDS